MRKLNYGKTFLLGFGFFAISVTWSVYNAFMPKILSNFISSATIIGIIMTLDNYIAIIVQPTVGALSDNINTRVGKRMPFIMVGMPLATVFILLLANYTNFITLLIFLVLMNISMSLFRSPVVSLMPDITYEENRSMANSIINFMGGLGAVLAYFIGSKLWDKSSKYSFYLAASLMIISFIVLIIFVREKRDVIAYEKEKKEKVGILQSLRTAGSNKSLLLLLFAILSWFIAYNGIETFFTLYGVNYLKVSTSAAAISFTFISAAFLLFAIPAGMVGTKLGKAKTIIIGIIGMICCLIIAYFIKNITGIRIMFIFAGIFWAFININSYPFVTDMVNEDRIGTSTGLYYLFSSIAFILSPVLFGLLIDFAGYKYIFLLSCAFFILALIFISRIKKAETKS